MKLRNIVSTIFIGCLVGRGSCQDISFADDSDSIKQECETVGGPRAGLPCIIPFRFGGKLHTGCIQDSDPDLKFWCSTKVDQDLNHVPNEDNWAHCGQGCKKIDSGKGRTSETLDSQLTDQQTSEIEGAACTTNQGDLGVCHLPSSCHGVSIDFLENNECTLDDSTQGVCCPDVLENNIINIIDTENEKVDLPEISIEQANVFIRFGLDEGASIPSNTPIPDEPVDSQLATRLATGDESEFDEDTAPSQFHLRFNTPRKDIILVDIEAEVLLNATKQIKAKNNLTDIQAGLGLRAGFNSDTSSEIDARCPWTPAPTCNPNLVYRTFDGTCNNLKEPNFGRTGTPYQRILLPQYSKGTVDLPRRRSDNNFELPSAREVSNALAVGSNANDNDNTVLVMQMGQFIDHDITHTPNHGVSCCSRGGGFPRTFDAGKCFPIRMFDNDQFWRGRKTCMSFARSLSSPSLKCGLQSREQLNQITHWMDGSNIYGSTTDDAMYLRSTRGRLKISRQSGTRWGSLPSCAKERQGKVTGCDVCGSRKKDCFFSGDFRVNEQLNLIVIHTLFMREHNRIAAQLEKLNPRWTDDKLYQEARRINTAQYQHIVYNEWLPIIIGNTFMRSYGLFPLSSGYSMDYADNFDPRINNEFATAAFRFGHSMIPETFSSKSKGRSERILSLKETFFKPKVMSTPGFLDGMVQGMTEQGSSRWDSNFISGIRDHLFESRPGSGGLDLVAINIQRGRDHGIPGYNEYRKICLGAKADTWADLNKSMPIQQIEALKRIYNSVDDVDLYVGGFMENAHEDSILGPVFKCIIGDQFARLKKGDRFFYDLGVDRRTRFTEPQLSQIRKVSMARIICDNTDNIDSVQPLAFKLATARANRVQSCTRGSIPRVNLAVFKDERRFGR